MINFLFNKINGSYEEWNILPLKGVILREIYHFLSLVSPRPNNRSFASFLLDIHLSYGFI